MTPAPTPSPFGPDGQPFAGLRPWALGVFGVGLLALGPVMLSDRAPSLFRRASNRIEAYMPSWLTARANGPLPESDVAVHLVVYAALALLLVLAVWSWRSLLITQLLMLVASIALELSQGVLTVHRSVELSDMVANAIGQGAGVSAGLALFYLWRIRSGIHRRGKGTHGRFP